MFLGSRSNDTCYYVPHFTVCIIMTVQYLNMDILKYVQLFK